MDDREGLMGWGLQSPLWEKGGEMMVHIYVLCVHTYSHETRRTLAEHPILLENRAFSPRCRASCHAPRAPCPSGSGTLDVIVEAPDYVSRAGFFQVGCLETVDLFFEGSLIRKEISKEKLF